MLGTSEATQTGSTFLGYSVPEGAKTCGKIMLALAAITALGACATFCGNGNLAAAGSAVLFVGGGALAFTTAIFGKIMYEHNQKTKDPDSKLEPKSQLNTGGSSQPLNTSRYKEAVVEFKPLTDTEIAAHKNNDYVWVGESYGQPNSNGEAK